MTPSSLAISSLKEAANEKLKLSQAFQEGIDTFQRQGYSHAEIKDHIKTRDLLQQEANWLGHAIELISSLPAAAWDVTPKTYQS